MYSCDQLEGLGSSAGMFWRLMGSLKFLFGWPFLRRGRLSWKIFIKCWNFPQGVFTWENCTGASFILGWLFDFWWVISYLWYLKVHFMLIHVHFKSQTLCIPYPFQSTCRPINTKTGGHFTFTWYRYEIFYLTPLQQRKWTYFGVTRTGIMMAFSGGIMYFKTSVEPWKGTRVNSDRRESRPGVM